MPLLNTVGFNRAVSMAFAFTGLGAPSDDIDADPFF